MKQVLQFFASSMASAPIKVQDVEAVSSKSNKSRQFPLATIEEARDEDELENSLVRAEEDAREEACEPVNTTPRQKQHKQDIVKPDYCSLGLKHQVSLLRKVRSLLRRNDSNIPTLTDGSDTPNDEIKPNHDEQNKPRQPKRSQAYIPTEISFEPNDNDDDDGLTANTASSGCMILESIRNFNLADLGDYAILGYERCGYGKKLIDVVD